MLLAGCQASAPFDAAAPRPDAIASARVGGIGEPGFPAGESVQLDNGAWQGAPYEPGTASRPGALLMPALGATGDLDGDGAAERVVLLAASSGGSGERLYLAVFGARGGTAVNRATVLVGDRSKPRALVVEGGEIVLEVVEIGPQEPACCGTQLGLHRYRLEGGKLIESAHEVRGVLSMSVLEGEWTLLEQDGTRLPAGARAPTLVFKDGAVSGFAGCNRFGGNLIEAAPGEFAPGPHAVMSTRMACPPPQSTIEDGYLRAVMHATRYTFVGGRLAIMWADGDHGGVLLFAR